MYKVETLLDNEWILRSTHKNDEIAILNAEVAGQSHPTRVIYQGKIIWISDTPSA